MANRVKGLQMGVWDKEWTEAKHAQAREAAGKQPEEEGVARTASQVLLDMACDEIERLKRALALLQRVLAREHT